MSTSTPTADSLATLAAQAQKAYSLKIYPEAVSLFALACEAQALLHGSEGDPRNAHLLYLYGKALYQVAISKSDILGAAADVSRRQMSAEAAVGDKALSKDLDVAKKGKVIHFQGDENWDDDDDDDDDGEGEGEDAGVGGDGAGEQQAGHDQQDGDGDRDRDRDRGGDDDDDDDMAAAWEVLDLARVLTHKTLDPLWSPSTPITALTQPPTTLPSISEEEEEKESSTTTTDPTKPPLTPTQRTSLLTQLSDIYDLLGEISLESENFCQSILDLRSSLALKLVLFSTHHKLVSEAHYKLSLALEFASAMEGVSDSDSAKGREEAAEQMELAVRSVRERITVEEEALASKDKGKGKGKAKGAPTQEDDAAEKSLLDAKEIVAELEQRLYDLRAPVPSDELESANPMISGLLKSVLGETQAEQKRRLEEAIQGANDVSGLVRRKEKPAPIPAGSAERGKRKLEDVEMEDVKGRVVVVGTGEEDEGVGAKKAKVEESLDVEEREGGSAAL